MTNVAFTPTPEAKLTSAFHVFKSSMDFCKYVFPWGKVANFIGNEYVTNLEGEVKHLQAEVAISHPHIYVEEGKETRKEYNVDVMEEVKKKAVADYIAAQALAVSGDQTSSTNAAAVLQGIATTANTSELSAESTSADAAPATTTASTAKIVIGPRTN